MVSYIALLRKEPGSDYGVDFPDFPGCVTGGSTIEEAREMAAEALAGHIAVMAEHGEPMPPPSSLEAVMADPDNAGALAFLVTVAAPTGRTVRVSVSLPDSLLHQIDAHAKARGLSRSSFLAEAARRAMEN